MIWDGWLIKYIFFIIRVETINQARFIHLADRKGHAQPASWSPLRTIPCWSLERPPFLDGLPIENGDLRNVMLRFPEGNHDLVIINQLWTIMNHHEPASSY